MLNWSEDGSEGDLAELQCYAGLRHLEIRFAAPLLNEANHQVSAGGARSIL